MRDIDRYIGQTAPERAPWLTLTDTSADADQFGNQFPPEKAFGQDLVTIVITGEREARRWAGFVRMDVHYIRQTAPDRAFR